MDDHGLTRLELEFLGDWFLDPGHRGPRSVGRRPCAAVGGRDRARRPPRQGRQPGRHRVPARAGHRALRRAVRGRGEAPRRARPLRVHAVRRQRQLARHARSRSSRRSTRPTAAWSSTPGTWPSSRSPPTSCGASRCARCRGSSCPTATTNGWTTGSTRSSTTASCPARASSTSPATSPSPRTWATPARGASRSCPRPLRNLPDRRDLRPCLRDDVGAVRNHHRPEGALVTDTVPRSSTPSARSGSTPRCCASASSRSASSARSPTTPA